MGEYTELAPAASFPVVLFDGEREMEFGSILVHPYLGFRRFQTIISQKIGISLNQISTSLVRRKKARSSPDIPRKVPINEYSDFTAISRERNCFILVTLKRPPVRIRSRRRPGSVYAGRGTASSDQKMAPEKMILKRNYSIDESGIGGFPFDGDGVPPAAGRLGFWDYDGDLLLLQQINKQISRSLVCDVCGSGGEEGVRSPGFHWCVYDAVTVGFRSSVGPIQRPLKKNIDVSSA